MATSSNGAEAWDDCLQHEPQIAFLDIRMPGLTGLEVARRLARLAQPPLIVFVSAHQDHALDAFDAGAIDYVLKAGRGRPPRADPEPLAPAPAAARARCRDAAAIARPARAATAREPPIQASLGREVKLIPPKTSSTSRPTAAIPASSTRAETPSSAPAARAADPARPEQFWQIHRSVLVNSQRIATALRVDENNMVVTLKGREEKLPVSRQFQGCSGAVTPTRPRTSGTLRSPK